MNIRRSVDTKKVKSSENRRIAPTCQLVRHNHGLSGELNALLGNETVLEMAVDKYGPVAVSIEATGDFMNYNWGTYDGPCSSKPKDANHGVLVVGYNKGVD